MFSASSVNPILAQLRTILRSRLRNPIWERQQLHQGGSEQVQPDFEASGTQPRWKPRRRDLVGVGNGNRDRPLQRQVTARLLCVTSRLAHFDTVTGTIAVFPAN
jgi:hypothetical protein